MWRWLGNRGDATPWHVHEREDEEIIVIDGVARFFVGDGAHDARAGAIIFLPRGVPHAYGIVSERAEVIGMAAPGGFEGFFTKLGRPVPAGGDVPDALAGGHGVRPAGARGHAAGAAPAID